MTRSSGQPDGSVAQPDDSAVEGVSVYELDLDGDVANPVDPSAAGRGRIIDVGSAGQSLLLSATLGSSYSIRIETDGRWGDPIVLTADEHEGPDEPVASATGVWALGPVRVEAAASRIEIVNIGGNESTVTATLLADRGPAEGPADVPGETPDVAGRQLVAPGLRPAIQARSEWTDLGWEAENEGCEDGPWFADNVQGVIVHHTVTSNNYSEGAADDLVRAIRWGHVRINGWCDIGYNFVVDRFGTIWEGRSGGTDLPVIGGHTKGFNTSLVGVAMLGQHQPGASPAVATPSSATAAAIESLAAWKLGRHGVDPAGTTWLKNRSSSGPHRKASQEWHLVRTVLAHRDLGLTSCPGDHGVTVARGLIPDLVVSRLDSLPFRYDDWTPAEHGPGLVVVDHRGGLKPAGAVSVPGVGAPPATSNAPAAPPSPPPIAVGAARQDRAAVGYVLHGDGMLHPFGGAPSVVERPAGDRAAVDVTVAVDGVSGWVVDGAGTVNGFGGRPDLVAPGSGSGLGVIRGSLDPVTGDGFLLEPDGRLRPVGAAPALQLTTGPVDAVDIAVLPPTSSVGSAGGWVLAADGSLHAFGVASPATITSPTGPASDRAFRAVVASASGLGGWAMTDDGQLWPFGDERLIAPVSTDTTRHGDVDVAIVASYLPTEFLTGDTAKYLDAVVRLFLDRAATPSEIEYWEGRLAYTGQRQVVTSTLARSDEWAGARIDAMYQDVLGRAADPGGRRYWVGQVRAGMSLQQVGVQFYGSAEYYTGAGSDTEYVHRLYRVLLGREPDAAGTAYWAGELDAGRAGPTDVAAGFYVSPESRQGRVTALYQSVLGRGPDPEGLGYWADRLLAVDDVVLASELATSDEFHATATR